MSAWHRLGSVALFALAGLQLAWHGLLHPSLSVPPWLVLALVCAPLLPALLTWRRNPRRGLLLGGIVGLFYFAHGVMEAWAAPDVRGLALIEAALVVVLVGALGAATVAEKRAARLPRP